MIKKILILSIISILWNCNSSEDKKELLSENAKVPELNLQEANLLAQLPLNCINTEYPNRLGQTLGDSTYLKPPKVLHPAFYGCFDWHSAVHGHWSLVSLMKQFPNLENTTEIKSNLIQNISKENIARELIYFDDQHNWTFERTYGWAWLLKLAEELHTWDDPLAKELEVNLQPLTDLIANKYIEFLPKLNYPIRVGEHPNTAFGLSFAWDYATSVGNEDLKLLIEQRAIDFYFNDTACPINWEPSGFDFLSPCLEEAAIMKRVLKLRQFKRWFKKFLPQASDKNFTLEPGKVSDRTDGQLVHLDGVNFSRAWSLNKISEGIPQYSNLKQIANKHINYSIPSIIDNNYEGGHWLGSFAIYALNSTRN
ncbi:MAG: DUF2891 domain-containing protein [Flavobacteriaceae bacterium]|nr:DUF2891 domain-containing protein [Flavobacteriaceae bacterium]